MNLTVRTLDQRTFTIEVQPTTKIVEIKTILQEQKGYPVENQKIIFSGKILADETSVQECQFEEKSFIVVMVSKPKKAAPTTSQPAPVEAPKAAPAPAPAPAPAATEAPVQPETQANPSNTDTSTTQPSSFDPTGIATGSAYESSIQNLIELGFERDQVVKAMRASFNNPDRAADYLFNGIPDGLGDAEPQADDSQADIDNESQLEGDDIAGDSQHSDPNSSVDMSNLFLAAQERASASAPNQTEAMARLAELRNSPQFQQFRAAIQQNPSLLQPLLAQIGRSNPEFLSLINSNQTAFLDLLSGDMDGQDHGDDDGHQYIQVTPEEKEAIDRLESLGFERSIVIQAYFACDKNEELTANYLFEHGHEE